MIESPIVPPPARMTLPAFILIALAKPTLFIRGIVGLLILAVFPLSSCESMGHLKGRENDRNRGLFSQLYTNDNKRALDVGADLRSLDEQGSRVSEMRSKLSADLERADDEDDQEEIEERLELVEYAGGWLAKTRDSDATSKEVLSVNVQVERILNEVDASMMERKNDNFLDATLNFMYTAVFGHSLPALSEVEQNLPLGARAAAREAGFLYNSGTGEFYSARQLAALSPEQVSLLDVSVDHPAWHRQDEQARLRNGRLENFEGWMQSGITELLHKQGDLSSRQHWNMAAARRVLFMDEVYKSATSPKAKTEDAYGVEWKIKWGDEVQPEAVSSRLYLMAGGKMTDLVFVGDSGPEAMIMVLREEGQYEDEKAEEGAEREPETVQQLVTTLHDFYGFDVTPYIHSHGIITKENVDALLHNLPAGGKSKYRKSELIGRHWVSFREYLVELRPDGFVRRENGSAMSDFAAKQDRVARGLYLLSLWMSNRDVKDDNNKAFYVKRADDGRIIDYREGHHDLGVTLGTMGSSAEINHMQTGKDFMDRGIFGRNFRFRQTYIYKPDAWKVATWADCKWMARWIAGLSVAEIREAVAASKWPDFTQEALVYKLLNRRDRIAEEYGVIDLLDDHGAAAPTLSVPLGTPQEIAEAESRYRLVPGSLAAVLSGSGSGPTYSEFLVIKGKVVDSDDSLLIEQLTIQRHPSGLSDRYRRMTDRAPRALR